MKDVEMVNSEYSPSLKCQPSSLPHHPEDGHHAPPLG